MSLPNPDAHIIFLALRAAAGNQLDGDFYQFGIRSGYVLAAAYGLSESAAVKGLRTREGEEASTPMNFWGTAQTITPYAQTQILSTGMPPERLKLATEATGALSCDTKAAVVYVSQDKGINVMAALGTASVLFQPGTVVVVDRWWALDRTARMGFDRWAHTHVPLRDFDNHFEVFHDNGWARAFMIRQ